ncbi:hypothetical protein GE09DRAFT_1212911 [Coniochaeta sp. 2T2.1]|nr:hypothetical protein GE09DRAFT_1212911 [Coniochaeta sp. 2T2.1]
MPGSTLPAPDEPFFPNSTFTAANMTANTSQWRPNTSRSGRSARSASPLFTRWTRRNHQHLEIQDSNDSRSSTDRKSTSSSGTSKHQQQHALYHDDASHKHTYNFSTSTMTRSGSSSKRRSQAGLPPPLTREEFEALPVAIQRKYFSTLERLRFAQASGIDDISQHYDQITARNFKKRLARQERSASENLINLRHRSVLESSFSSADSLAFAKLPDKIKKRHFTPEEQTVLTRHLRTSVILDAADEVVFRAGRRASRHLEVPADMESLAAPSFPKQRNNSMDSPRSSRHMLDENRSVSVPQSFYDTFRWLDEEEDLDLRLFLDDYHANLRENVPEPSKQRRPSFRRHLSISKIPFGRPSLSSRPPTRDAASSQKSPAQSPLSPSSEFHFGHQRRKSRTLSLITPKHASHNSFSAIDPAAAHYQDPEARLKLRVYLASPQKFDEAIEFGFPSTDIPGQLATTIDGPTLSKRQSRQQLADDSNLRTFLADDDDDDEDDKMSLSSDQPSVADPDSPQTPHGFDKGPVRPIRVSPDTLTSHASKPSDGNYVQVPASSREMTLRMTLTRPDLRANEDQIYGWQKNNNSAAQATTGRKSPAQQLTGRKSHQILRDDSAVTTTATVTTTPNVDHFAADGGGMRKESMEKIFAGIDHWNATNNNNTDQNVMRRIWNRVRRS